MNPATSHAPWRCERAACGSALARRTRFCPYCGALQTVAAEPPLASRAAQPERAPAPPAPVLPPRPQPPAAAAPPSKPGKGRGPSLRTLSWILFVLLMAWLSLRPSRLDQRVERAVTMAAACQSAGAKAELARLKALEASARQLARIDAALAAARPACERAPTASAQTLIADARRAMAAGDYGKAVDRMEVCIALIGAPECGPLLRKARRLQGQR